MSSVANLARRRCSSSALLAAIQAASAAEAATASRRLGAPGLASRPALTKAAMKPARLKWTWAPWAVARRTQMPLVEMHFSISQMSSSLPSRKPLLSRSATPHVASRMAAPIRAAGPLVCFLLEPPAPPPVSSGGAAQRNRGRTMGSGVGAACGCWMACRAGAYSTCCADVAAADLRLPTSVNRRVLRARAARARTAQHQGFMRQPCGTTTVSLWKLPAPWPTKLYIRRGSKSPRPRPT
mmetsp:Transcript_99884/g.311962  ORF Transcript_99884/g.311962 Transcript_99884/m.311962 type:complete len:239 (+) Transcript_99884:1131-1847(+)